VVDGQEVEVPDVRGLPYDLAAQTLTEAGFGVRNGGRVSGSEVPRGDVARTSPRAGRTARAGTTVTIYTSNGRERVVSQDTTATEPVQQAPAVEPATAPQETRGNRKGKGKG
jgi:serine/threonine-protein kinase